MGRVVHLGPAGWQAAKQPKSKSKSKSESESKQNKTKQNKTVENKSNTDSNKQKEWFHFPYNDGHTFA